MFALSILGYSSRPPPKLRFRLPLPFLDGTFVDKDPVFMRWVPYAIVLIFLVRGIGMFMGSYGSAWVGQRGDGPAHPHVGAPLTLPQRFYGDTVSGKPTCSPSTSRCGGGGHQRGHRAGGQHHRDRTPRLPALAGSSR